MQWTCYEMVESVIGKTEISPRYMRFGELWRDVLIYQIARVRRTKSLLRVRVSFPIPIVVLH